MSIHEFGDVGDAQGPRSRYLPALPRTRPRILAHRGLALDGAENTLRAFHEAVEVGADIIETDVRASADGRAFTLHDATLERVAGDPRAVASLTAGDLRDVRIGGETPCTLEEALDAIGLPFNIDVKSADAIEPTARAIARTGAVERVCVTSFDGSIAGRAARAVARLTGAAPTRSASWGTTAAFTAALALGAPQPLLSRALRRVGALQIPREHRGLPVVTARSLEAAHRAGCEVHVWTIDDPLTMRSLIAMGADGIVTNRSDVLARLLQRGESPDA